MAGLVKALGLSTFAILISISAMAQQSTNSTLAPVGHRQPTRSEVADERTPTDKMLDQINRDLDKKLRSICRGC